MKEVKWNSRCLEKEMAGHEGLRIAIVRNAIQDYAEAYKKVLMAEYSGDKALIQGADRHRFTMGEVERFFLGEWYALLCNLAPSIMLECAKEKGEREYNDWLKGKSQVGKKKRKTV